MRINIVSSNFCIEFRNFAQINLVANVDVGNQVFVSKPNKCVKNDDGSITLSAEPGHEIGIHEILRVFGWVAQRTRRKKDLRLQ